MHTPSKVLGINDAVDASEKRFLVTKGARIMRASIPPILAVAVVMLAAGCCTTREAGRMAATGPRDCASSKVPPRVDSVIGTPVQTLFAAAERDDARIEYFIKHGGSVSIDYGGGQNNYSLGVDGRVTRHMRSIGEKYGRGVWDEVTSKTESAVGAPVRTLIAAAVYGGARVQFFLADGGSVSIHKDSGQDNYAFGTNGVVTGHMRSQGENYARGIWEAVP